MTNSLSPRFGRGLFIWVKVQHNHDHRSAGCQFWLETMQDIRPHLPETIAVSSWILAWILNSLVRKRC